MEIQLTDTQMTCQQCYLHKYWTELRIFPCSIPVAPGTWNNKKRGKGSPGVQDLELHSYPRLEHAPLRTEMPKWSLL